MHRFTSTVSAYMISALSLSRLYIIPHSIVYSLLRLLEISLSDDLDVNSQLSSRPKASPFQRAAAAADELASKSNNVF